MALNLGGLGAFLGGNNGQGGFMPQVQQLYQQQQQKAQQAQAIQALRAALASGQIPAGPPQGGMGATPFPPPGVNAPSGVAAATLPPPGANAPPGAIGKPQITPMLSAQPQQTPIPTGGRASMSMGQDPATESPADTGQANLAQRQEQMMIKILDSSATPAAKMKAFEMLQAFVSPVEQLQTKIDMQMQALEAKSKNLEEQRQNILALQAMKNSGAANVQDLRNQGAAGVARTHAGATEYAADAHAGATRYAADKRTEHSNAKSDPLSQDTVYAALKNDVAVAKADVVNPGITGEKHDEAMKRYTEANKKLADYGEQRKKAAAKPATKATKETAGGAPQDTGVQPGEPIAIDADGNTLVVRNGQWVKAGGE